MSPENIIKIYLEYNLRYKNIFYIEMLFVVQADLYNKYLTLSFPLSFSLTGRCHQVKM